LEPVLPAVFGPVEPYVGDAVPLQVAVVDRDRDPAGQPDAGRGVTGVVGVLGDRDVGEVETLRGNRRTGA